MAERGVARVRLYGKPTFIYCLSDPDTLVVRYVGKTVKSLKQRRADHLAQAKASGPKRHVLAWISGLLSGEKAPIISLLETVPPMEDWVDAEQRWIATHRALGCDLCNLTIGGEGQAGYRQPPETIAKRRVKRGPDHHQYGKPARPGVIEAAVAACKEKRKDPEWVAWANARRSAGFTSESRARSIAALLAAHKDPEKVDAREKAHKATLARPEIRAAIGADSKRRWSENREKIIAAQNAGKGAEWRRKQSEIRAALWADPEWRARILETRRIAFINRRRKPVLT